jgi:hypothetical protein
MKLIARHHVHFALGKDAPPGHLFEVSDEAAANLIASGAADEYVAPPVVATTPASVKRKASADIEL